MPRMLPLSGHKISLHDVDKDARQWHIKAKSFGENQLKTSPKSGISTRNCWRGHLGLTEMGWGSEVHWTELLAYLKALFHPQMTPGLEATCSKRHREEKALVGWLMNIAEIPVSGDSSYGFSVRPLSKHKEIEAVAREFSRISIVFW